MMSNVGGNLMEGVNTEWLPHLNSEIVSETEGNYLDAYVVALEGWRRGLTLRWHIKDSEKFKEMKTWFVDNPGQLFSLHSHEKDHYFFRTRGDKVSNEAVEQGMNKEITKKMLSNSGVMVPEGKEFTREDRAETIIEYASHLGYPVVIKPTDGSFGRGVMSNITSEGELRYSLDFLRNEMEEDHIIVEKHIPGNDYRLYVVGDVVVGAIHRVPPNVIGDGINSLEALIDIKNAERKLNPRLANCPIKIDQETVDYIRRSGYTLDSIPEADKVIYTNDKGNVSIGGDPIDVLDDLSTDVKETAVAALQAVPGLTHGAVDLIVYKDEAGSETGYVIELNPTAQIGGILFPFKGQPRDVPKAIIDYYFPETKDVKTDKEKIYFDFYDVLEPLISRQGVVTTVSPAPLGTIYMKKYIVFGDVQNLGYHLGLRKQAFERGLHGFVMNIDSEAIEIIVAGTDPEMINDFKNGITEDEERATVVEIQEESYDGYVKVGFDSRANLKTLEEDINILKEEIEQMNRDVRRLEIDKRKLHNSLSWKLTYPVRFVGAVKKIFR